MAATKLFPRPSLLHIAWAGCLWPWAGEGRIQPEDNAAMSRGREIHAAIARLYLTDIWAPELGPWKESLAVVLDRDRVGGGVDAIELKLEHDVCGRWFGGTADLVISTPAHRTIIDWKTGHESPGRASDCVQLYAYARLVSVVDWGDTLGNGNALHIEIRWLKDDGAIEISSADVCPDEIAAFGAELEAIAARLDAGGIEPVPGEHCERCPARINCPAHNTFMTTAAGGMGIDFDARSILSRGVQSAAEARGVYHAVNALKHGLPILEEHLRAYVHANGPVEVNPGVHLRATAQKRRSVLDTPQAITIIERELADVANQSWDLMPGITVDEVLKVGVTTTVSKHATVASLERAATMCGKGAKGKLFDALRAAGVVEEKLSIGVKTEKEGWSDEHE